MKTFHPIVISGPSGAGKDALIKRLLKNRPDIYEAVGYTTRALRDGEINGVDIAVTTEEEFKKLISNGRLIEYTKTPWGIYYGMPFSEIEKSKNVLTVFNVSVSAAEVIKQYDDKAITILVIPPTNEELSRRRGDRGEERAKQAKPDVMLAVTFFDYVVISQTNQIDDSTANLERIINGYGEPFKMAHFVDFLNAYFD